MKHKSLPQKGHKEIESVSYRPVKGVDGENGSVIARVSSKTARGGQGGGPMYDYNEDETALPSMEHVHKHMKKHLGSVFGVEPEDEGEGKPSGDRELPKVKSEEKAEPSEAEKE